MTTAIRILAVAGTLTGAVVIDAFVLRADDRHSPYVGFGAETVGGDGGQLLVVTSLDDRGEGTLRWAVEDHSGPRIVHFDVSGTIQLKSQLQIGNFISILGETAPNGITLTGSRLRVVGDEVIISGLRIRPGTGPGSALESRDGISIGKDGTTIQNVVIDGNSITWAVDENLSIWGDVQNVTISNNIIADALDEAGHPKGGHSMGLLIGGGDAARVSVVGNLFANNANRNPTIKDNSQQIEVINNLVYNWSENGLNASDSTVHAIGNTYLAGPDTVVPDAFVLASKTAAQDLFYLADNIATARVSDAIADGPVFDGSGIEPRPAKAVADHVLNVAGARLPQVDLIDQLIIDGVRYGTGRIIDMEPDIKTTAAQTN